MQGLFGTSGIRGVVNRDFFPDFYLHIGLVIGSVIKDKEIAVAADGRVTMPIVKSAVLSGLTATGHDVVDIGVLPTPALQYYCKNKKSPGVMVTASHNPVEYNGIKLILNDGTDTYRKEHRLVEKMYSRKQFSENASSAKTEIRYAGYAKAGQVRQDTGGRDLYVNGIAKHVDVGKIRRARLRVLFDCVNGSTTQTTPWLFKKLGINAVPLNERLDGTFPAHPPEPTEANLEGTIRAVKERGVDFAIVFDSDGDRSIFLSPSGSYIDGNFSVPIIAREKLRKGDSIVMPVNTADTLQIMAEELGLKAYMTKIGRPHVVSEMLKRGAKLGGEENGGVIFGPHQYCGDGGMALALFAEAVAAHGLDSLLDGFQGISYLRDKVQSDMGFSSIRAKMLRHKHTEVDETDGLKMRLDSKRWIMVRKSGTEPVYRIYAQAGSRREVGSLISSYKKELFGR